jgi:hypothetical protein
MEVSKLHRLTTEHCPEKNPGLLGDRSQNQSTNGQTY